MKKAVLLSLVLLATATAFAQSKSQKMEATLTSKKWVCLEVKRKKLTKMDFRFEVGNELSFSIDKKFSFKNNDYNYQSGTWKLDGKYIYLFYNSLDGANRTESMKYQIKKLSDSQLFLKRLQNPKGKLLFK